MSNMIIIMCMIIHIMSWRKLYPFTFAYTSVRSKEPIQICHLKVFPIPPFLSFYFLVVAGLLDNHVFFFSFSIGVTLEFHNSLHSS